MIFKNHVQLGQTTSGFCHAFQGESSERFFSWVGFLSPWIKLGEAGLRTGFDIITKAGRDAIGLQGTDNVVPTGCRMPELAAEKLT